jgi:hypothetical protein
LIVEILFLHLAQSISILAPVFRFHGQDIDNRVAATSMKDLGQEDMDLSFSRLVFGLDRVRADAACA